MSIHALVDIMDTMLLQHEQLLDYGEQKRQALMRNDVSRLIEITDKESRLIKKIEEMESQRQAIVHTVTEQSGLKPDPGLKVSDIVRFLNRAEDKRQVSELAERLSAKVHELKRLNDANRTLLQQAMDINQFSLDLFVGGFEQDFVYTKPTDQAGKSGRKLFDSKA